MKGIVAKIAVSGVVVIILAAGSYYWGYLCGKQEVSVRMYEQSLVGLANDVLIRDALEGGKTVQARPLVTSRMETEFANVVQLHGEYSFASSEHVRCAVSRKVRALKQTGQLMADEKTLQEAGYPVDEINSYLDRECPGEPSHADWSDVGSKKKQSK